MMPSPGHKYDFQLECMPGTQPQASMGLALLTSKNSAFDNIMNNGIARGTICRTTSRWAFPVLFAGKTDSNLQPRFDYQKSNEITVKKMYPL